MRRLALIVVLATFPFAATAAAQQAATAASRAVDTERRLAEAVRLHPDSFDAHHALAEFYLQQGKLAAAIPHLERARAIDPTHYANGYDLAIAYIETGKLTAARDQVQRLLKSKDAAELHNLLGDIAERAGDRVAADGEYQKAAHLDATEEHLFDWGNNLLQLRTYDVATQVFQAGIKRHPTSARLHIGLGIAQYSRGQYDDAVRAFCQASDLAPTDPRPYEFLGEMYGVSPELAPLITERLARFIEVQPKNALAHYYYAMNLWKGQGAAAASDQMAADADVARIESLLRRAVALSPKLAKAHLQLGILLADQRRFPDAIVALRDAVRIEPGLAQAHYRLAQAYQRTGQKALAAEELKIFEKLKSPQ
jgi:tetratricopeptide (TPR) repeat protein